LDAASQRVVKSLQNGPDIAPVLSYRLGKVLSNVHDDLELFDEWKEVLDLGERAEVNSGEIVGQTERLSIV